jgi:hypothetical protein
MIPRCCHVETNRSCLYDLEKQIVGSVFEVSGLAQKWGDGVINCWRCVKYICYGG